MCWWGDHINFGSCTLDGCTYAGWRYMNGHKRVEFTDVLVTLWQWRYDLDYRSVWHVVKDCVKHLLKYGLINGIFKPFDSNTLSRQTPVLTLKQEMYQIRCMTRWTEWCIPQLSMMQPANNTPILNTTQHKKSFTTCTERKTETETEKQRQMTRRERCKTSVCTDTDFVFYPCWAVKVYSLF